MEKSLRDKNEPADQKPEGAAAQTHLADGARNETPTRLSIYKTYGIRCQDEGSQVRVRIHENGENTALGKPFDDSPAGLKAADAFLRAFSDKKKTELTARYGVSFSTEGEDVEKQVLAVHPDQTLERGNMLKSRAPTIPELYGIEAALRQAAPSQQAKDGKVVKFYFLKDPYVKDGEGAAKANFVNKDKDGRPAVYVWPKSTDRMPVTEKDNKGPKNFDYSTIQSTLTHELAHNTTYRLGWDNDKTLAEACKKLGWDPYDDPKTKETIWLIRGKKGEHYNSLDGDFWVATDSKGKPVDRDGKVVLAEDKALKVTTDQVRDLALYAPPTPYCANAVELAADSFMMFRVSKEKRAALLTRSPVIYDYIKGKDQEDIDISYGKDAGGHSKMIRIPTGLLERNTEENRQLIQDFEQETIAKNKKR